MPWKSKADNWARGWWFWTFRELQTMPKNMATWASLGQGTTEKCKSWLVCYVASCKIHSSVCWGFVRSLHRASVGYCNCYSTPIEIYQRARSKLSQDAVLDSLHHIGFGNACSKQLAWLTYLQCLQCSNHFHHTILVAYGGHSSVCTIYLRLCSHFLQQGSKGAICCPLKITFVSLLTGNVCDWMLAGTVRLWYSVLCIQGSESKHLELDDWNVLTCSTVQEQDIEWRTLFVILHPLSCKPTFSKMVSVFFPMWRDRGSASFHNHL